MANGSRNLIVLSDGTGNSAAKAFELSEMTKALFRDGLRRRFPDLSERELHKRFLEGLARCHNRNY